MKILTPQALETTSGVCIALPSSLKYRARLSSSHLSIRSRVAASHAPSPRLVLAGNRLQPSATESPVDDERRHMTFLVDAFHQKQSLKALLDELSESGSCPLRILARDEDWPFEKLRVVIAFLVDAGRATEALQVFHRWKSLEKSRASVINYCKIIRLFCEKDLIDKAMLIFQDMEKHGRAPSVAIYNAMIHGFARIKGFDKSKALLTKMMENGSSPVPETYNGLIQAYGTHGCYDDMSKCVKMMESAGCRPNELTYNLLIQGFSHGRLLERMERFHRTLLSKRLNLHSRTLIAMLEAYSDLGVLGKMEEIYSKVLNSNTYMEDDLIRKMANVFIQHRRFARLEEFGDEIGGKTGRNELVWSILLLSAAGLLSRRSMSSMAREMEIARVRLSTTLTNIFALFYLKMKDFNALNGVFSEAIEHRAEPDIVTVGILFDAGLIGYNSTNVLEKWKRFGFFEATAQMKTDSMVLSTFGKGPFMSKCEKLYTSLGSKAKEEKKLWKYIDLIRLVLNDLDDG